MQSGIERGDERHRGRGVVLESFGMGLGYRLDCDFGIAADCEVNPLRGSISGRHGCFISGAAKTRMLVRNIIRSLIIIIIIIIIASRATIRRYHTHRRLFELGAVTTCRYLRDLFGTVFQLIRVRSDRS